MITIQCFRFATYTGCITRASASFHKVATIFHYFKLINPKSIELDELVKDAWGVEPYYNNTIDKFVMTTTKQNHKV
jgi:hypothetical protein